MLSLIFLPSFTRKLRNKNRIFFSLLLPAVASLPRGFSKAAFRANFMALMVAVAAAAPAVDVRFLARMFSLGCGSFAHRRSRI